MFTLKLYKNGPLPPAGKTVIVETVGLWISHCEGDVKHIHAYKRKVGVQDEDGTPEFYVGGQPRTRDHTAPHPNNGIYEGDDDYYTWGVLENAMGKTTEMFR